MQVTALITASGLGQRMGGEVLKQFLPLGEMPLLVHAIAPFQVCPAVTSIILVLPPGDVPGASSGIVEAYQLSKVKKIVPGGLERADSVYQGLLAVSGTTDYVMIHDGVRPFVSQELIARCLEAAIQHGAAIPALPPKQTVKQVSADGFVLRTLERSQLQLIQTPQTFRYHLINEAYQKHYHPGIKVTDDSQLLEWSGVGVKVIGGEPRNLKVTTPEDLILAELYWRQLAADSR